MLQNQFSLCELMAVNEKGSELVYRIKDTYYFLKASRLNAIEIDSLIASKFIKLFNDNIEITSDNPEEFLNMIDSYAKKLFDGLDLVEYMPKIDIINWLEEIEEFELYEQFSQSISDRCQKLLEFNPEVQKDREIYQRIVNMIQVCDLFA